jgi:D-alanyl-D-alanine carboxypeptidase/D-alanyl-D-alanine-endopeptidase (penicillin-binding protein 4)
MRRTIRAVRGALALAALLPCPAARAADALPAAVLQALKQVNVSAQSVAAYVHEIGAAQPRLAFNAAEPMNPASVMKLVTTYAGLELLGPTFTWRTEIYASQAPQGGVLKGDLFLKGGGDPKLTIENFWLLLRGLRARGIREIHGDLVIDRAYFEVPELDPGKFDQEPLRPYNVGPYPLLVNFKAVRFQFLPDPERGVVQVVPDPALPQLEVQSNIRLTAAGCGDWRGAIKPDIAGTLASAKVSFAGSMPAACGERSWYIGLLSHPQFVYGTFRSVWEEMGGVLRGNWREGPVPAEAKLLTSSESPPMTEVIRDINKFSNNVMARQLFLTLSAEITKLPGRADRSERAVKTWLQEKGLAMPELTMENGSGLSRIERVSARSVGQMLLQAYRSPVMPEFISSMPLLGLDGTMRRAMRAEPLSGQAHIKTGGLNGVRSIAGYVLDRRGRRSAVALIINHPNAHSAYAAQNAFLRWVYERGESAR